MRTVNGEWIRLLLRLLNLGEPVCPDNPAGATKELIGFQTEVSMTAPVITISERKLGYRFMAAESAWILSGDNRLSSIFPFAKGIADTCDDGLTLRGAYGPKFIDQVGWVAEELRRDPASRRAVSAVWRERPGPTKDTPCTLSIQWLVRDRKLHAIVSMRSSDAWLGFPYDIHTFSMMSLYLLLYLRQSAVPGEEAYFWRSVDLGMLRLTAGSQHLYDRDAASALRVAKTYSESMAAPRTTPLDPDEFFSPDDLVEHLWRAARKELTNRLWLTDLIPR
jgi:thymidylate synthase